MNFNTNIALKTLIVLAIFSPISRVNALPWDTDMYSQQSLKSNEVARAPVKGTVPLGHKPFTMTMDEAEKSLKNPVAFDSNSVWRGQRLWNTQCLPCHGATAESNTKIGKLVGAPNLLESRFDSYSDGRIYGTIMLGVRGMPRYGYKLSEEERWDVVNYLKFLKGKDVEGMKRPVSAK
jgi:mono/diheme cytochrome c family protein